MLKGKKAVITGGSRGIGRAVALRLAGEGADIAVIYSSGEDAAREVCDQAEAMGVRALAYACDVADYEAVRQTCEKITAEFGGADILVNNAGITRDALLLRMAEEQFDTVLGVNLKGAFNFIKHLSRVMLRSEAGRIINITSVAGLMGNPGQANYASAKAGLIGLTKTIAKELAPRRVTCNAIAPGFIATDMTANLPDSVKEYAATAVPLKRMGGTEEVAALVAFLASAEAAYITGEVIRIDGGLCM